MKDIQVSNLIDMAWQARKNARILGSTAVGAAVLADSGQTYLGCNVEHRFRSHDVHAEVNALTSMVASGGSIAVAVAVVSMRDYFTPCGSCMDWIFELGSKECTVYVANESSGLILEKRSTELMPFYPY